MRGGCHRHAGGRCGAGAAAHGAQDFERQDPARGQPRVLRARRPRGAAHAGMVAGDAPAVGGDVAAGEAHCAGCDGGAVRLLCARRGFRCSRRSTWLAVALVARPEWCRPLIHYAARLFLWLVRVPVACHGIENLPAAPCVLAANHTSYLDGIVLAAVLPPRFRYAFVAKREFAGQLIPRRFLRGIGAVLVERYDARQGAEDVEQFAAVLRAGTFPVFFPEGTFDRRAGLQAVPQRRVCGGGACRRAGDRRWPSAARARCCATTTGWRDGARSP